MSWFCLRVFREKLWIYSCYIEIWICRHCVSLVQTVWNILNLRSGQVKKLGQNGYRSTRIGPGITTMVLLLLYHLPFKMYSQKRIPPWLIVGEVKYCPNLGSRIWKIRDIRFVVITHTWIYAAILNVPCQSVDNWQLGRVLNINFELWHVPLNRPWSPNIRAN